MHPHFSREATRETILVPWEATVVSREGSKTQWTIEDKNISQRHRDDCDYGACRSENRIDQMQRGKLNTGSRIQSFLRCFAFTFDFALSLQNMPIEAL